MKQDIEIHIDELVLHGFDAADPEGIRSAVTTELTRLFKDLGIPSHLTSPRKYGALNGGRITLTAGDGADPVGNNIAAAVFDGMKNSNGIKKKQ